MKKYVMGNGWQILFNYLNLPMQDILRHARLPLDLFSRNPPMITAVEYFRIWDGLDYVFQHASTYPLRLAQSFPPEAFTPPIFACLWSKNLNVALERIAKYKPIVGPLSLQVEQNERQTTVRFEGLPEFGDLPDSLVTFEQAFWVEIARIAIRERITPETVHVKAMPTERTKFEAYFGTQVIEDKFDGLAFSAVDANKPFLTAKPQMWSIFEPELNKRLQDITQESGFRDRVRACLVEILASGHYSMNDVASRLAISTRTLQRRLKQEDTSFQKELDSLREELARHYLSSSDYTSNQIAFLLGYEEPTSFFRAFRTWTGQTPEHVRSVAS